jgi:hypothetical protein
MPPTPAGSGDHSRVRARHQLAGLIIQHAVAQGAGRSQAPGIRRAWLSPQTVESLQKLLAGLDRAQQVAAEPDSAIAGEWRAGSPSFLASLEQLLSRKGTAEERSILRRGLATRFSAELLQRIQSVVLNTTRLVLQLRPYREFGAKFAVAVRRGLLGDDMDLGKTLQALAAIAHATEADGQRHHLVVCPASLIDTWLQEIRRALASIAGWRFHGTARDTAFRDWLAAGGILVTSFQQAEHLLARQHSPIGFASRLSRRGSRADHARLGVPVQAGGGRPPYGYRLADAGPHPNKAHAAWGRRVPRSPP